MLAFAALIALFGLLQNSVAVIIGAMLISPLMNPVLAGALHWFWGIGASAPGGFRAGLEYWGCNCPHVAGGMAHSAEAGDAGDSGTHESNLLDCSWRYWRG